MCVYRLFRPISERNARGHASAETIGLQRTDDALRQVAQRPPDYQWRKHRRGPMIFADVTSNLCPRQSLPRQIMQKGALRCMLHVLTLVASVTFFLHHLL